MDLGLRALREGISAAPTSYKALNSASEAIDSQLEGVVSLLLLVDRSVDARLLAYVREKLRPQTSKVMVLVRSYGTELPDLTDVYLHNAELALILAASSPCTSDLIELAYGYADAVVTITTHPAVLIPHLKAETIIDDIKDIIPVPDFADATMDMTDGLDQDAQPDAGCCQGAFRFGRTAVSKKPSSVQPDDPLCVFDAVFDELADWMADNLEQCLVTFAKAYPFLRRPVAMELMRKVALENALIGAAFFIPGADMPLLTLNQMRLALQIAAMCGHPLGTSRIKEMAVLVVGAFGSRTLVRFLVKKVSMAGFAIRASIAYAATIAVGLAAYEYYNAIKVDSDSDD